MHAKLTAEQGEGADPEDADEYRAANVFWVPHEARWSFLQNNAKQPKIGKLVDEAMDAIERDNPTLKGVLPKQYARPALDKQRLGELEPDYIVEDGDVLFSWSGSLECVLWAGGRGALNQHLFKVTSPQYPKWLYYLWIHQHLADFRHIAAGKATTMGHIQRHHLSDAKVVLPGPDLLRAMDRHFTPIVEAVPNLRV